ncbi:MAG: Ig-like domain-containing protein, partial [Thalassolituus sp.]
DAPVIDQGDTETLSLAEDATATINLSVTDVDADGEAISWSLLTSANNGSVTIVGGNGVMQQVRYSPDADFFGSDSFVIQVSDGELTDTIVISVNVSAVNDAPVITEGAAFTAYATEDTETSFSLNATDVDGDAVSWAVTVAAANGVAAIDASGVVNYLPAPDFSGVDTFTVTASDSGLSDSVLVTVNVSAVNDAPVITSVAPTSAVEGVAYTYDVIAADPDSELTFSLTEAPAGMTIDSAAGVITWTPANGVTSADVTVEVTDGPLTATQSLTIAVSASNDAPEITSAPITVATEGVEYVYLPAATDPDGDALTWSLTQQATGMNINPATGEIRWTPANGVTSATVNLVVSDNVASDSQLFIIAVAPVNDAPVITEGETAAMTVAEDASATLTLNASDADGDTITWSIAIGAAGGTASVSGTGASQVVTYTPNADFNGSDAFTVQVADETATDTILVNVTVTAANDAPVITSSAVTTAVEGSAYAYQVVASDVDGDSLTYSLNTAPADMTISATGLISWTPANGVTSEAVTVVVSDVTASAEQSFVITVSATNDAPEITSPAVTTATEDTLYTYDVEASDIDAGTTLTYRLTTAPDDMTIDAATGVISWTPAEGVTSAQVTVEVSDGIDTDTQSFTITVAAVNDAPVIDQQTAAIETDEDVAGSVTLSATDAEGTALTWIVATAAANGSAVVDASGLATYTPNVDFNGNDSFVVEVSDGDLTDTITVNVTVAAANDAPAIDQAVPAITTDEDVAGRVALSATDTDGDELTWTVSSPAEQGTAEVDASGNVTYTPSANFNGSDSFTVEVSDSSLTDTRTVTVTVAAVNDAPEITSTAVTSAVEDAAYSYTVLRLI